MQTDFDSMADACIDAAYLVFTYGTPALRAAMRAVLREIEAGRHPSIGSRSMGERDDRPHARPLTPVTIAQSRSCGCLYQDLLPHDA
jgi:hypothetical protein